MFLFSQYVVVCYNNEQNAAGGETKDEKTGQCGKS